jgi:hypothetical protein
VKSSPEATLVALAEVVGAGAANPGRTDECVRIGSVAPDPYFKRMLTWLLIAFVGTLLFAAVVVVLTVRWFEH